MARSKKTATRKTRPSPPRDRDYPVVAAIQWVDRHADGFDRLALLIDAADYMFDRRDVDPNAANHVAISFTMMREELRAFRGRLISDHIPSGSSVKELVDALTEVGT